MSEIPEPQVIGTRLAGKVAIVTGGGSGFGEGIAKRFAEEGCNVIVADMDPVGGERVANYHAKSMHFFEMDVTKEEDWEACIDETLSLWARLDILVNNAGTSYKNKVRGGSFLILMMIENFMLMLRYSQVWTSSRMSSIECSTST